MSEIEHLEKTYNPATVEGDIYQRWLDADCFGATPDDRPPNERFTIVIPPPNVTGALHLGHALNNTLQDILVRWHRMMGHNTLWLPGTDHAGIATQAVVERRIKADEGKTRHDIGREELVKRIWAWKDQYEERIVSQLKLIGCSCDWNRKRFTLDEGLAKAVRHTFFNMFKDGLIFRGKRLVNWDTQLQTAVADDEVYHEVVKGNFWHFKYPIKDAKPGEPDHVIIATTRPETMLGDTAVAVHPDPQRAIEQKEVELRERIAASSAKDRPALEKQYEHLEERRANKLPELIKLRDMANDGRKLMLPLVDREIPLITDKHADPLLGTGCVKITPAHDHNDYEVGIRNELPMLNMMNTDGTVNEHGGSYEGMLMLDARKQVATDMEERGLLDHVEDKEIDLGHSDRSKSPVEPYLSDQWFLKMGELADPALDVVRDGAVKIFPERYAKSYLDWLGEKRDWCISRQLWWGHRIPVWSKTIDLTESNWSDELAGCGLDSLIENAWGENVAYRIENLTTGEVLENPKQIILPVVKETEGTYRFLVCVGDTNEDTIRTIEAAGFVQDPDVLDTWFSSALWPHSTLGWPDEDSADLKYYYPTSVLVTSRDIITLWVVRMVTIGLYNMGEIPFDEVYIHTKILDGRGETMSKSKGNGVDPLDVVTVYGADALRYSIAEMATETQDVRMPVDYICPHCGHLTAQAGIVPKGKQPADVHRVKCSGCKERFATQWAPEKIKSELPVARETSEKFEVGRNFCNKLWNSARFAFMNLENTPYEPLDISNLPPEDRWILAKLSATIRSTHAELKQYHYAPAIKLIRELFWESFCDWYIELSKPRMRDEATAPAAKQVLALVLDQILRLLSPFMPFVTERLWEELNRLAPKRGIPGIIELPIDRFLMQSAFPPKDGWTAADDEVILKMFDNAQQAVRGIRDLRNKCTVSNKDRVKVTIKSTQEHLELLGQQQHIVERMAGTSSLDLVTEMDRPKNAGTTVVGPLQIFVHDVSDDAAEKKRLEKEMESLEKRRSGIENKLANEKFVNNAKPQVVAAERERLAEVNRSREALLESLSDLSG
ncbi:MAG: valine--tRNA ligase [Planctomycetes bacterium]|nr:valine--tRNA ligase [Planctomycetota bacterium]